MLKLNEYVIVNKTGTPIGRCTAESISIYVDSGSTVGKIDGIEVFVIPKEHVCVNSDNYKP